MAEYNGYSGKWVTSKGRRVFIRDGETITESILRYNKEKGIKTTRNDIQSSKLEYEKSMKKESWINSDIENEKEYNQKTKEKLDADFKEKEYNSLYENPRYYDEMEGTPRDKAKALSEKPDSYKGKHEEKNINGEENDNFDYTKRRSPEELKNVSDKQLEGIINTHNALYEEYNAKAQTHGDLRTRNGKLDNTFNKGMAYNYEYGRNEALKEAETRGYEYDKSYGKLNKKYTSAMDKNNKDINEYKDSTKEKIDKFKEKKATNNKVNIDGEDYSKTKDGKFYKNEDNTHYLSSEKVESNYETGNYNPMEEYSDTVGDGLSDLQNKVLDNLQEFEVGNLKSMAKEYMQPEEIDSHEGDLYLKKTPVSEKLIKKMKDKDSGLLSTFKDQQTGETWYDIPFANVQDDFDSQIGFVQHDSMYGGVIKEYTNKELREMEERGIRPKKDSYGHAGAWEGINSDKGLSNKEIAKTVQDEMKKKYPNTKLARSTSGYNSVEMSIMSSSEPIIVSNDDIDKMGYSDFGNLSTSTGFDRWAKENVEGYSNRATYSIDDVRNYAKTQLKDEFKGTRVSGDEWYLTKYGKDLVGDMQKQLDSYNYDDSNGMVDYFNSGFYDSIHIGKWNKPYESTSYNKSTLTNENDDIKAKVERFKKRKGKK